MFLKDSLCSPVTTRGNQTDALQASACFFFYLFTFYYVLLYSADHKLGHISLCKTMCGSVQAFVLHMHMRREEVALMFGVDQALFVMCIYKDTVNACV